jgi:transcriptional antiterminator NusG
MTDAFVAYVRFEEKVLLMQRADQVADFPGAWDGIYGVGDANDVDLIAARVEEATGIPVDKLVHIRDGPVRGLAFGNRLSDVTPHLFVTDSEEVTPGALYKNSEWVDPGKVSEKEYSIPQLRDMYGDVASYLYILKTSIGQEANVSREIRARISSSGSLKDVQGQIFSVLHPHQMRGYIFVEASAEHHVEKVIGRVGTTTTPLKNCRKVLHGEVPIEDVFPYLEPKAATAGIEEGCIVEIRVGAFKGQRARVTNVSESKEEVTVELFEAMVPIPLTVRGDQVRVTQRVE